MNLYRARHAFKMGGMHFEILIYKTQAEEKLEFCREFYSIYTFGVHLYLNAWKLASIQTWEEANPVRVVRVGLYRIDTLGVQIACM
jgi:hypothetical protein